MKKTRHNPMDYCAWCGQRSKMKKAIPKTRKGYKFLCIGREGDIIKVFNGILYIINPNYKVRYYDEKSQSLKELPLKDDNRPS